MFDPVTAVVAVAAVVSAGATIYKASEEEKAADKQNKLLKEQARQEREAGQAEADNIREKGRRLKGQQAAALAASGVKLDSGTAAGIMYETDTLAEKDALLALKGAGYRASNLETKGKIIAKEGDAGLTASYMTGASKIIGAVGSAYGGGVADTPGGGKKPSVTSGDTGSSPWARRENQKYSLLNGGKSFI